MTIQVDLYPALLIVNSFLFLLIILLLYDLRKNPSSVQSTLFGRFGREFLLSVLLPLVWGILLWMIINLFL